ncbi:MAG TPA: peptidoglycan-associated lipoprotein Pal [Terriglobia bacterium]|nr:peptidoglycan-associated lipoprotein Pal [Terriglobia bacterium]
MKSRSERYLGVATLLLLVAFAGACRRPTTPPPPPPPPPPPAPAPSVSLTVEPSAIERGQSALLRWSSQNATELDLQPGIGRVDPQGTRSVSPTESTTYTLSGRGPGGSASATARLTVTVPPPPPPPPPAPAREPSLRERFNSAVSDAYFDFDKSDIRDDARVALTRAAEFLRANPTVTIQIEGHCDERGSVAYNLGLGDRRANSARDFLISLGVSGDRITTISYGKERPFCTESTEQCWQQNRRAHLVCTNCGQ